MATIRFSKLRDYELMLGKIGDASKDICGAAIYEGAKIIADEVKANLESLKTVSDADAIQAAKKEEATYLTVRAKKGLIKSFGVTPMSQDRDGIYNVKLGFDGYNDVKTKKWPKGQPNQLIARACESGSSAMIKQPFFRQAVQKTKKKAESRMAEVLDEKIKKTGGF